MVRIAMKASAQPAGDSSGRFTLVELEDCYEGDRPVRWR
jgi:hypothetical protein